MLQCVLEWFGVSLGHQMVWCTCHSLDSPFTSTAPIPKQHCYAVVYVCVCVWLCWALGVVYLALLGLPFDLACLPYPVWAVSIRFNIMGHTYLSLFF